MHYSFRRRSLLALAALPLAATAAHASSLIEEALPAAAPITSESMVGKRLRVLGPNSAMTMDYSEDRVNIETDEQQKIVRVFVG